MPKQAAKSDPLWIIAVMVIAAALISWVIRSGFFLKPAPEETPSSEPPVVKTIVETPK